MPQGVEQPVITETPSQSATVGRSYITVLREVSVVVGDEGWRMCLQWARWVYTTGQVEHGYRFIWRRPDGSMHATRGQARLPSLIAIQMLVDVARQAGWNASETASVSGVEGQG